MHENLTQQEPADDRHSASHSTKSSVLVTLLVFMASVALVRFVMPRLVEEVHYSIERGRQRAQFESATERLADDPLAELSTASRLVNQKIAPSVVHIETRRGSSLAGDALREFDDEFDDVEELDIQGQGSGVIISEQGEIITNYHVIRGAEKIVVTLSDDRQVDADVVGVDRITDLALLKIEEVEGLVAATWGDSEYLEEGSMVWAVGSPFGLSKTITFGILSAKDRRSYDRGQYHEFLQSDAAVSAGNSGGPLVDSKGNVVGINTAIIGPTYQGISFAIPSNRAQEIYDSVLSQSQVSEQGYLGVTLHSKGNMVRIARIVEPTSPAKDAGIEPGDIITEWEGEKIDSPKKLQMLIAETQVNTPVTVVLTRDNTDKSVIVTVAPRPLQF